MGNRATYYLVRDGELVVSSSKWGSVGLDALLLGGRDAIRHHFDPPDGSYAYSDEIMCEAGYVVDDDTRRLCFFGGNLVGHVVAVRDAYLELLALAWPEWSVSYAHDGIRELGELIGGHSRDVVDEQDLALLKPVDWAAVAARPPLVPAFAEGEDAVVVSVVAGATVNDHLVPVDDLTSLLGLGPGFEERLGPFRSELPAEADNLLLRGGAILEPAERRLVVWLGAPRLLDFQWIARRWPGWTLERQHEGLPRHAERTGRDPAAYRLTRAAAILRILQDLDGSRRFRGLPEVRAALRGVAEDDSDEALRLAQRRLPQAADA